MVGLKAFWILCTLFLLGACVPQTKQTECKGNEAFNASLRTCVPVIGGPSSFINISSYVPMFTATRYKNDNDTLTFSITISNQYNQSYSVEWERVFNAAAVSMCSNALSCSFPASYLGMTLNQVGTHILTAKVKDGNGSVVDTHSFELKINDEPKPAINNSSVIPFPSIYTLNYTPLDGAQDFSFNITNNNLLNPAHNWKTTWNLTKNGAAVPAYNDVDVFVNFNPSQSNPTAFGDGLVNQFNPSLLGPGTYVLRAVVTNDIPGEVVGERTWYITVTHPDFGVISSASNPLTSVQTTAYHNVSYDVAGFVDSLATKADYCVQVSQPEGAYTDGSLQDPGNNGVVVRFYKDGVGSPIFEDVTTSAPLKDTICFSDASLPVQQQLFFSDGSPTVPHMKKLTARVFDVQTGLEMCVNGATCSVTYPVKWDILVKPQNTPPVAVILNSIAGDKITYGAAPTASTSTISGTVQQGVTNAFTVRFKITDDALEYDPFLDPTKFKITPLLKQGTTVVDISSFGCDKAFVDPAFPGTPTDGGTNAVNVDCTFSIASSDLTGPLANLPHALTILVEDLDSPVPGSTSKAANLLTWNLTVTEEQTAPTITLTNLLLAAVPTATFDEGQTITFNFAVSDAEKDQYNLTLKKCADATCTVGLTDFADNSITQNFSDPYYTNNTGISYTIEENELGADVAGTIYFKVVMSDIPTTPGIGLPAVGTNPGPMIVSVNVNPINPPPVISILPTATQPATNTAITPYDVVSGYRFQIATVGAVTDASNPASGEGIPDHRYQWWIKGSLAPTWTEIEGATTATLTWTPGPELTDLQYIKFCVSDESVLRADISADPDNGGICSETIYVTPRPNLAKLAGTGSLNGESAIYHVPGERTAFVAYASPSKIYVEKFTYNSDGSLNTSGMRVAEFNTVSSVAVATEVNNLSLTVSQDYLYVAYSSDDALSPGSFKARVRKMNISNVLATEGSKTASVFAASTRKFDFSYSAISVVPTCTAPAVCTYNAAPRELVFDGNALDDGVDNIAVTVTPYATVNIPVSAVSPTPAGSICAVCTASDQAQTFVSALNSHASTDIQGLTAIAKVGSPGTVVFKGVETDSFYDGTDTVLGVGKIVFSSGRWYLPVINASLLGADQNKIQLLSGPSGDVSIGSVDTGTILTSFDKVSAVDNAMTTGGNMLVGYITFTGSTAKVMELTQGSSFLSSVASPRTIFSGVAINELKVKPSLANNPNIFVSAKDSNGDFRLARLPSNLATAGVQALASDLADVTDGDNSIILGGTIVDIDLQPAPPQTPAVTSNEARVVVVSEAGTGSYNSYLFRWKQTVASPTNGVLDCSEGQKLEAGVEVLAATSKVVLSPAASVTIGSSGNIATDNTNASMVVTKLHSTDEIELGIVNTEIETIQSTTRSPAGSFRPTLVR